ncbi:MAG: RDD family protein [Halobacteriota archaeon]
MSEDKCAQCGTPASPGAQYCVACGAVFAGQAPPAGQPAQNSTYASAAATETHAHSAATPLLQGVAIRFVAQLVDVIILAIIFLILSFSGAGTITIDASTAQVSVSPFFGALMLIDVIIAFLYFTLLEGRNGQTVGKMIVKIKVAKKADYSPITYGEAAVRTILRIIDLIPFIAPYLLGAVLIWASENKQRLGDRVANTIVIQS